MIAFVRIWKFFISVKNQIKISAITMCTLTNEDIKIVEYDF